MKRGRASSDGDLRQHLNLQEAQSELWSKLRQGEQGGGKSDLVYMREVREWLCLEDYYSILLLH